MLFSVLSLVSAALLTQHASAAPPVLERRLDTSTHCGQWDTVNLTTYMLYLDQWGLSNANSGQACASITSFTAPTVAWKTNWTWTGGSGVKSYTNIGALANLNKQLSAIKTIPAVWKWSQTTSGTVVANIAYDLFTSSTSGGSNQYEIMIWLSNIGAGPISYTYNSAGQPTPIASNLSIAGKTWNVYYGSNGSNLVYSFLTSDGSSVTSFSGDLMAFFTYLTTSQGLSKSQYLTTAQGGTEATSGTATLTSSAFSIVIN